MLRPLANQAGLCCCGHHYYRLADECRLFLDQNGELANRPTSLKVISVEVLMRLAILPGPQAGQAREVMHKFTCTPHQADQVANVSKPQDQGRSSSKVMLVSLVKQLCARSQESLSVGNRKTMTLQLGLGSSS